MLSQSSWAWEGLKSKKTYLGKKFTWSVNPEHFEEM